MLGLVGRRLRRQLLSLGADQSTRSTAQAPARTVRRFLIEHDLRRAAVVDEDGALLGLMCLKRHQASRCSDHDVAGRADGRQQRRLDGTG
jgi:hypothetical protein